jgi:predicted nucleic acid-binding protein
MNEKAEPDRERRIYVDVCALCRPFDDQSMVRIRLETHAVQLILAHVRQGKYEFVVSPVHLAEIGATTHDEEKAQVLTFFDAYGMQPSWDLEKARERAEELYRSNCGPADAAHVAFAEQAAEAFITCDDMLLRKCRKTPIRVPVVGPVEFSVSEGLK